MRGSEKQFSDIVKLFFSRKGFELEAKNQKVFLKKSESVLLNKILKVFF